MVDKKKQLKLELDMINKRIAKFTKRKAKIIEELNELNGVEKIVYNPKYDDLKDMFK